MLDAVGEHKQEKEVGTTEKGKADFKYSVKKDLRMKETSGQRPVGGGE
jgi:hypothetical protein